MKKSAVIIIVSIGLLLAACSSLVDDMIATVDVSELGDMAVGIAATEIGQLAEAGEALELIPSVNQDPGFCEPGGINNSPFLAIGYLPEYRQFDISSANCLSDLIFFSLEPTAEGALDTSRITQERIAELQEAKRLYNLRLHLSLGGWGRNGGFSPTVLDEQKRSRFVTELVTFIQANRFDGVDFDWEFPESAEEIRGYAALIEETKSAIAPNGGIVSVAFYPHPELDVTPYLNADRIHIMSYDRDTRHATYEQAVSDVALFLDKGVPADKLILGLPFYGRLVDPPFTPYTYADIYKEYSPASSIDEAGSIFFNGWDTIMKKTCYAQDTGLGGIMIWEIGQDIQPGSAGEESALLRAIYQAITLGCE